MDKSMKDKLLLIFWGIITGAVFVGGILCFGQAVNWLSSQHLPMDAWLVKTGLVFVISSLLGLIYKVAGKQLDKAHRMQAEHIFSQNDIKHFLQSLLGQAVVEQREDIIEQLRFLPMEERLHAINAPIYKGLSALHIAAALGLTKFCKLLYKYGADINARDIQGQTPLDWANKNGFTKTSIWLEQKAGKSSLKVVK